MTSEAETAAPRAFLSILEVMPEQPRARLLRLRALIHAAGRATDTGPLTETLKWGQMAFLPARRAGTTLRLSWSQATPDVCRLLVHCQTTLVDRFRDRFPDGFAYEGNRAVCIPVAGPMPEAAFQQMAAMALTYHRDKAAARP